MRHANGGDQGTAFQAGVRRACRAIDGAIVKRTDTAQGITVRGFTVLPRCWVAERTMAWLNRCRRLDASKYPVACLQAA